MTEKMYFVDWLHTVHCSDYLADSLAERVISYIELNAADTEDMRDMLRFFFSGYNRRITDEELSLMVFDEDGKIATAAITKDLIRKGLGETDLIGVLKNTGIIRFVTRPDAEGVVAKVGQRWFYFSNRIAAEGSVRDYLEETSVDTIVEEISDALEEIAESVSAEEYMYFYNVLTGVEKELSAMAEDLSHLTDEELLEKFFSVVQEVASSGLDAQETMEHIRNWAKKELCNRLDNDAGKAAYDSFMLSTENYFFDRENDRNLTSFQSLEDYVGEAKETLVNTFA